MLVCGSGEYVTGWTSSGGSKSDKTVGVVALVLFDLRRRGKVGNISIVGTSGKKFAAVRDHFEERIKKVYNMPVDFTSYPSDDTERDPEAYKAAIDALPAGSAVIVFTPDPTHHAICQYAIAHRCHVLVTKPAVKTVADHYDLIKQAELSDVLVQIEAS